MKKLFTTLLILIPFMASASWYNPVSWFQQSKTEEIKVGGPPAGSINYTPTLLPFNDSLWDVGTSTNAYRQGWFDELCFTGDICRSTWPTGGGGSGGGTFSTSTSGVSGQLFNYPNNATDIVLVGSNSSTTAEVLFDPNTQSYRIGSANTASTTLLGNIFLPTVGQGFLFGGTNGLISKIASSSINLSWFNNDAGFLTSAVTSVTGTYPVQSTGGNTPVISLAFGTSTSNTWGGTQVFTNTANFNTFTNNGSATTTNFAITALTGILKGNGSTAPLSVATAGTDYENPLTFNYPLSRSTNTISFNGLGTTTALTIGQIPFVSASNAFSSRATTSVSCSGSVSCTSFDVLGASPITITGSGGSSSFDWQKETNFGALSLTPTTTIPVWLKSALYASSTITVGTNQLSTHASLGFLDFQRNPGNDYTVLRIRAPQGACGSAAKEATLAVLIDFNGDNSGINERFNDFYNEHCKDSEQSGIRIFATGSATLPNAFVFGFKTDAISKDAGNVAGFMPSGTFFMSTATSTVDTTAKVFIASSTANYKIKIDDAPGTNLFSVLEGGFTTIATTTANYPLTSFSATAPQLSLSSGGGFAQWVMRSIGNNLYFASTTVAGTATTSTSALELRGNGAPGLSIGSSTPFATLSVNPVAGNFSNQFVVGSSSATSLVLNNSGFFGLGTTSPWGLLSINASGSTAPYFSIGSSTATLFAINQFGGVQVSASQPATTTTITLDWSATGPQVEYQIGTSATTITIINATTTQYWGTTKRVWVCNPGASAGALSWKGVEWFGTAPTQTTTANACDLWSFNITKATSTSAYKVAGAQSANFQ